MTVKIDPAKTVIERLGGPAEVSRALGVVIGTVCAWENLLIGKGRIPEKYWESLQKIAKYKGIKITVEHLSGKKAL